MSVVGELGVAGRSQVERSSGELITVDEAIERFRDEWVLMKVTEKDEHHWPARGYVLAHSLDEAEVNAALANEPALTMRQQGKPAQPYYVFNAYPRIRSGPDYVAGVSRFVADFITHKVAYDARKRR